MVLLFVAVYHRKVTKSVKNARKTAKHIIYMKYSSYLCTRMIDNDSLCNECKHLQTDTRGRLVCTAPLIRRCNQPPRSYVGACEYFENSEY